MNDTTALNEECRVSEGRKSEKERKTHRSGRSDGLLMMDRADIEIVCWLGFEVFESRRGVRKKGRAAKVQFVPRDLESRKNRGPMTQ